MTIKKITAMMLVLVCLVCFAGCGKTPGVEYTDSPAGSLSDQNTDYNSGSLTEVDQVLANVASLELGTENETVEATKIAVNMLVLCDKTTRLGSELAIAAQAYYLALADDAKQPFSDRLAVVGAAVDTLKNEETKAAALEAAQVDPTMEWSSDAWNRVVFVLRADK